MLDAGCVAVTLVLTPGTRPAMEPKINGSLKDKAFPWADMVPSSFGLVADQGLRGLLGLGALLSKASDLGRMAS